MKNPNQHGHGFGGWLALRCGVGMDRFLNSLTSDGFVAACCLVAVAGACMGVFVGWVIH